MTNKESINNKIEQLRPIMVEMGMELGLSHPAVVNISQAIDGLLNELNRLEFPSMMQSMERELDIRIILAQMGIEKELGMELHG